jgi:hypothetical protein
MRMSVIGTSSFTFCMLRDVGSLATELKDVLNYVMMKSKSKTYQLMVGLTMMKKKWLIDVCRPSSTTSNWMTTEDHPTTRCMTT